MSRASKLLEQDDNMCSICGYSMEDCECPTNIPEEEVDTLAIIKELIDTKWGGSNDEQGKAVQLMKGLAFSDDPMANKFMQAIDDFTSDLDPKEFEEGSPK